MIVLEEVEWINHNLADGPLEIDVESWASFADRDYTKMTHEEFIESHLQVCKDWNRDMGFPEHSQYIHSFTIKFKNEEPVTVEVKDENRAQA